MLEKQNRNINKLILTSTDKAYKPINQYGKTKAIAENIVAQDSRNAICRYGNVFGSRGSVIHRFLSDLDGKRSVDITDKNMTRFFMTKEEASNFVIKSMGCSGIQIPNLKSTDLLELAEACSEYLDISDYKINFVGNRGKEKIHEEMSEEYNSETANRFTRSQLVEMIQCLKL